MSGDPYLRYARWEPLTPLAKFVLGFLAASAVFSFLQIVALLVAPAPTGVIGTMDVVGPRLQEQLAAGMGNGIGSLGSLLQLVTGVVWLVWQHRAQSNLYARRVVPLKYTPGWAVGWWFVPFANLVLPLLCMREVYGATVTDTPGRPRGDWRLYVWWGLYVSGAVVVIGLVPFFVDLVHSLASQTSVTDSRQVIVTISAGAIRSLRLWSALGQVTRIAAAGFAAWIVWAISTREDAIGATGTPPVPGAPAAVIGATAALPAPPPPRPDL